MTCPAGEPEHPRPRSSDGPEEAGVGKESTSSRSPSAFLGRRSATHDTKEGLSHFRTIPLLSDGEGEVPPLTFLYQDAAWMSEQYKPPEEQTIMTTTTIIVILLILLLFGGGWGYSRRGR